MNYLANIVRSDSDPKVVRSQAKFSGHVQRLQERLVGSASDSA
jgi:hypothetical protein